MSGPRHTGLDGFVAATIERHPSCGIAAPLLNLRERDPGANDALEAILRDGDRRLAERFERLADAPGIPRVTTVGAALRDLGFRRVHAAAVAATTVGELSELSSNLDPLRFWRYACAVGALATLCATMDGTLVDESFPAGFFHAIGRLVLDQQAPETFARVDRLVRGDHVPLLQAESAVFGFDETALGSALALRWGFPGWLVEAIAEGAGTPAGVSHTRRGLGVLVLRARLAARTRSFGTEYEPTELPPASTRWLVEPVLMALDRFGGDQWLEDRTGALLRVALLDDV